MFYQDGGKLATLKWLERGGAAISTTSRALDSYDRTSMTEVGRGGRGGGGMIRETPAVKRCISKRQGF